LDWHKPFSKENIVTDTQDFNVDGILLACTFLFNSALQVYFP
jgi:hypothetical protein